MRDLKEMSKRIKGWGIDADPLNNPTYPMRKDNSEDDQNYDERPFHQRPVTEILKSSERPSFSYVVGETLPPKGISGRVRRYAFQYSESRYRHWLPLLLADRINEIEGIFSDFRRGKIPNILKEKGLRARWTYDRTTLTKEALTFCVACVGLFILLRRR